MNLNIHLAWRKTILIRTVSLNKISFEFIFVLKGSINVIDIFIWFWKKHIQWYYYCFLYKIEQKLLLLLLSCFSRVRLCDPIDGSPPGSPITGILQARTLEWVAISFSTHFSLKKLSVGLWNGEVRRAAIVCSFEICFFRAITLNICVRMLKIFQLEITI